jgi:hypothetical protein
MTERASILGTGDCLNAPTRELARRRSGTLEVLLLCHPRIDGVELSVSDMTTGESFQIDVAPETAMDAFHHLRLRGQARKRLTLVRADSSLHRSARIRTVNIDGRRPTVRAGNGLAISFSVRARGIRARSLDSG